MSDPRFFRKYLDILAEQPVTANIDDNTSATVDPAAKTISAQTKIGDLDLKATHDRSAIPATSVTGDYKVSPSTTIGATQTQTGFKGQMAPTSQVRTSHTDAAGQTHNVRVDKGVMFGGASGPNVGKNTITTYTKT